MTSKKHGGATSPVEVFQVSALGFWLYLSATGKEYFLPFREFPWFQEASYRQLSSIAVERGHILRWPELDVDLDLQRIEHPERFPLIARSKLVPPKTAARRRSARRKTQPTPSD